MESHLNSSWQTILASEIQKPYFKDLMLAVANEYSVNNCFPPKELLFSAFDNCSFDDLKVVIIGQDPYHGEGEANGLCFSVNENIKIPPSLRNIFRELNSDLDSLFLPTSGNLERWAKQGVLLLNATITVQKYKPNSHKHLNWGNFSALRKSTLSWCRAIRHRHSSGGFVPSTIKSRWGTSRQVFVRTTGIPRFPRS